MRGRLTLQKPAKDIPASFSLQVESPPGSVGATVGRGTAVECKISPDRTFACLVPATPVDMIIRVEAFVPEYRWDVKLIPGAPTDLGTIVLREGASVVAWLDSSVAKTLQRPATARLTRMTMAPSPTLGDRLNQPVAEATFNKRGFVQLFPIAPGTYTLQITAAGFAPVRLDRIEVYERSESALRSVVKLEPPVAIRLTLDPPHDVSGAPWRLRIDRLNPLTFLPSTIADGVADENGKFRIEEQAPGQYAVRVSDHQDNVYTRREISIHDDSDAEQFIKIGALHIQGKLTTGEQDVAANLLFGGQSGSERISSVADRDGRFDVVLPRSGKWSVDVRNEEEGILAAVSVTIAADEDELTIDLPDTEIGGRVTDPGGERVAGAVVSLQTSAGAVSRRAASDGTFRFRGVSLGKAMIHARDPRTSEHSRYVPIEIMDGQHRNDLELTTRSTRTVKATVVAQGQPIVGARVTGYGFGTGMARREQAVTGLDGGFELSFPVSTKTIAFIVAAPGRTLQAFSTPPTDARVTLEVATIGGVLRLRKTPGASRPGVTYGGTPVPFPELMEWAEAQGEGERGEFIQIPNVAPGVYRFCVFRDAADVCSEGTLAPGSVLSLGGE